MRVALLLWVLCIAAGVASAQSLTTGAIQGVVKDKESGEPLPGVTVTVGGQFAVTDGDGAYKVTDVLPGTYDVVFTFEKAVFTKTGVQLGANDVRNVNVKMIIGESIHVEGSHDVAIRTDDTTKLTRVDRKQIEKLPNPGPNAEDAVTSIPGSQNDGAGVAIGGSSGLENRWVVDGVDMTGLTFGNVGTSVLNDFVHEITAVGGGYNAEYGRATGGIVNIITRRGTDEIRGSVFGVIKPGILTARAQVAPSNASSIDVTGNNVYDGHVGFELGGPIIKKKAWFYIGAAPQAARTDYTRTIKRQTDCRVTEENGKLSTCQPGLADGAPDLDPATGFYITDKVDEEVRAATSRSTQIIGKINVAPSPNDQGQISLIAQPSSSRSPALYGHPSTATKSWGLTTDTAARWSSKMNDDADEVEATIAWHRSTYSSGALDSSLDGTPLQVLSGGSLFGISHYGGESPATIAGCTDGGPNDPYSQITNCPMNTTYALGGPGAIARNSEQRRSGRLGWIHRLKAAGTHEIKGGVDVEDNLKTTTRLYSGGALIQNYGSSVVLNRYAEIAPPGTTDPRYDQTCSTPDPNDLAGTKKLQCRFLGGLSDPSVFIDGETVNWGAYLQDSWQIRHSLTFNAGMRYEEQRLRYADRLRNTVDTLTGNRVGANAMTLTGNWSPRLGVIWDPTEEGRSKLYVNWGRYYEGIPMDINDRSFGGEVSVRTTYNASQCGAIDPMAGFSDGTKCLTTNATPVQSEAIGSSGTLVAPGIKAQYMDEGMIGGEVALPDSIVFGALLQARKLGRVIEDVSTDGANTYIIANPGEWSARDEQALQQRIAATDDKAEKARLQHQLDLFQGVRTFDKPVRDYRALELKLSRQFTSGYYLAASYTYSRTEGNYPGLVSYDNGQIDPNISSQYDLIELLANRRGALPQDRPHYFKLDAYRDFDLGHDGSAGQLTIGTRIRALSGIPRNTLGSHYLYGADESYLLPRGVLGRTEVEHGIDIHVAYKRKLSDKTAAELYVDVFNLYNRQGTFRVDETYAPAVTLVGGGGGGVQENVNPISGGSYEDLLWAKQIDRNGAETGTPIGRNPNFGNTTARYAPASAQVGFRVTF